VRGRRAALLALARQGPDIMRTFVFTDEKSKKFWNIDLQGTGFTVTFGKVGTKGQTQTKDFPDEDRARKAHDKLVAEKLDKGYVETTPAPPPALSTVQRSLEEALVADPDDVAAHSAYADYLTEQGDLRGELIQVQLALEQPGRPPKERKQLQQREADLLKQHARQWLGDLGRFLVGDWSGADKPYHYHFARGWLDTVRTLPVPNVLLAALARSPEARLLRRLEVVYDMRYHPFEFDQFVESMNEAMTDDESIDTGTFYMSDEAEILPPLLESPNLTSLRTLKLGFSDAPEIGYSTMVSPFGSCTSDQVIALLRKCPRLEELYLNTPLPGVGDLFASPALGNVRVLQYYYGEEYSRQTRSVAYPLRRLANNASLQRLTTLRLHPGRDATVLLDELDALVRSPHLPNLTELQVHMTNFGDEGCRRIVESGILRRLKVLDLSYGNMTDEGARLLAACPDAKKLDPLNVSRNALTQEGIAALKAAGIQAIAVDQHAAGEEDYLYQVDYE
jgi:uncharacterized protein (TIGR02996 family)